MKLTRILPEKFAIGWQEYDLARTDDQLEYHRSMAKVFEKMSEEGHSELRRLKGGNN